MQVLVVAAAIEPGSEPAPQNFWSTLFAARAGRMDTWRAGPGGYVGLTPPCLLLRKIVPSLTELPIFQIALQQKRPAPPQRVPYRCPTLLAGLGRKKQHPRDAHCGWKANSPFNCPSCPLSDCSTVEALQSNGATTYRGEVAQQTHRCDGSGASHNRLHKITA
jgi:hypothetical protein